MTCPIESNKSQHYGQLIYDELISQYDEKASPSEPGSLSSIFNSVLEEIHLHTQVAPIIETDCRQLALRTADDEFVRANDRLQSAIAQYAHTGIKGIDPSLIFSPYATAYDNFQAACPGGGASLPDCTALRVRMDLFNTSLSSSFYPPKLNTRGNATLSISAVGGKNSLQEVPEVPDLKTNYQMMQITSGIRFHVGSDESPVQIKNSGPLLETGISVVAGSPENLGSHRTELDLRAGWRQALFAIPLPNEGTIEPAIKLTTGLGTAFNALSFGNGYIDPNTNSLMTSSQVFLDTGYCWPNSRICTELSGGFFYEKTLLGLPDYQNMGALFGLTFTSDINLPHKQH